MSNKITKDLLETINVASATLTWWTIYGPAYEDLISKLETLGFEATLAGDGVNIRGSGDKKMLVGAFRALRAAGFNTSHRPAAKDSYYSTYFTHDTLKNIWFSFSSTVCQRVQIGTEMKEVPVFEIQCSDNMEITDEDLNTEVAG
jgi:hypothetical protein